MKNKILRWGKGLLSFCLKYRFVIIALIVIGGCFYWFEWRPTEIKKECSFVPYPIAAVTELTQDQIDKDKLALDNCVRQHPDTIPKGNTDGFWVNVSIRSPYCTGLHNSYGEKPRSASPARNGYREASPSEYTFCLHSHGI